MSLTALLVCVTLALSEDPPSNQGDRIEIGEGVTLFIPPTFQAKDGRVNVVLHLHGATSVVEPALTAAGWDAVLVAFNRKGLSSVYTKPFSDPALFPQLLDDALKQTAARRPNERLVLGKVMVSSFSAGFGGVRELLKVPANRDRIDAIVMADSIYCGYTGDPAAKQVDPALMAGFVAFAKEAAAGRKRMLVTHSAQVPDGYAGTTETADVLIAATDAKAEPRNLDWGDGWRQTRQATRERFEVLGFAGAGPDDHMRHLRRIADLWKRMPRPFDGAP